MARINIEDSLLIGKRFEKLMLMLGSKRAALGALVECWAIAQNLWKYSDNGIPRQTWDKEELAEEIILSGLAEDRGDFIYVRGSSEHFGWIRKSVENGKKGGRRPNAEIIKENSKPGLARLAHSLPSISSSSSSSKEKNIYIPPSGEKQGTASKGDLARCLDEYLETLKQYGINSTSAQADISMARLLKAHPVEDLVFAIQGMRYEKRTDKYNPANHVTIRRLMKADAFEYLRNLGARHAVRTGDESNSKILQRGDESSNGADPSLDANPERKARIAEAARTLIALRRNGNGENGADSNDGSTDG